MTDVPLCFDFFYLFIYFTQLAFERYYTFTQTKKSVDSGKVVALFNKYKDPDDEPSRNTSQDADWDISDDSGLAEIQGIADPDEWMFPDGPDDVDEHLEDLFGDDWKNNPDAQIELDKIKANNPNLRRALESREQIFPSDTYEADDLGDASAGQ